MEQDNTSLEDIYNRRIEQCKENVKYNSMFYNFYLGVIGLYHISPLSKYFTPDKYELAWDVFNRLDEQQSKLL